MNAGAMGGATFDVVTQVRFMDDLGRIHERSAAGMNPVYRSCPLLKTCIALGATFQGQPAAREIIAARTREFNERRWRSQPKEPSAGCIFKNPSPALSAGRLIDEAGLKGARVGGASVSGVHGNFIINDGTATARDVLELIELIRARVKAARGIDLQTEVEIVGEDVCLKMSSYAEQSFEHLCDARRAVRRAGGVAALRGGGGPGLARPRPHVRELDPAGAAWQLPPDTELFSWPSRHLRGGRRRAGAPGGIGRALHRLRPRSQPHRLR